jgi:hypothetical protein
MADITHGWSNVFLHLSILRQVTFPQPFRGLLSALSVFSLDFLAVECLMPDANHPAVVTAWALAPMAAAALNGAVFVLRRSLLPRGANKKHITRQHTGLWLLLTCVERFTQGNFR